MLLNQRLVYTPTVFAQNVPRLDCAVYIIVYWSYHMSHEKNEQNTETDSQRQSNWLCIDLGVEIDSIYITIILIILYPKLNRASQMFGCLQTRILVCYQRLVVYFPTSAWLLFSDLVVLRSNWCEQTGVCSAYKAAWHAEPELQCTLRVNWILDESACNLEEYLLTSLCVIN